MAPVINTAFQGQAALPPLSRFALAMAQAVVNWETRRLTRRSLGKLDAHMLRDIGLHPTVADVESEKPFWRA